MHPTTKQWHTYPLKQAGWLVTEEADIAGFSQPWLLALRLLASSLCQNT